ncbi:hypothetical protein SSAG_03004 [Streptomyces sp. Mg1]|nr:hypothetical protein SSAG_03004 [Streptomyces sp. Mg1]
MLRTVGHPGAVSLGFGCHQSSPSSLSSALAVGPASRAFSGFCGERYSLATAHRSDNGARWPCGHGTRTRLDVCLPSGRLGATCAQPDA